GDPALREVVGADALAAVAAADLQPARLRLRRRLSRTLLVQQPGLEQGHGAGAVLVLAALVLALDDDAGGQVGDADGRVGLVDVLAAGAGGAEGVHPDVGVAHLDLVHVLELGQDGHGRRRGVDAALRFGGRHALHAVGAGFELQARVGALALDAGDDFLVAAVLALAGGDDFHPPALALGVAAVHAEQVAG